MEETRSLTVHLITDAGLLAIMTPEGLHHRARNQSWWTDEDSLLEEANAGRLVPIETGDGGGFAVKVTFDELSERERALAAQSAHFWLRVGEDEEISVVSGEELSFPDTPGASTFWATPGLYHVTVTRIRWTEEADDEAPDSLPDYVACLQPFDDEDVIPEKRGYVVHPPREVFPSSLS